MKKIVLFFLLFSISSGTFAENVISPDINGLFEASIICTGSGILDVKTGKVHFTIQEVLKNNSDEVLYKDGEIIFHQPTSCGFGLGASTINNQNYIVYIRKYKEALVVHGGTQHFRLLKNGKIPFELCHKTYYYSVEEFKRLSSHFFLTFEKTGDLDFAPIMPKSEYVNSFSPFESILSFYECLKNGFPWPNEEIVMPEPVIYVEDTTIYKITEIEPVFPGGKVEMMGYISERIPDSISNVDGTIRGNVYVQFVVEKDGSLSQFKVLRGIAPRLDEMAVEIVKTMPKWTPAKQRGKAVRFNYIIPVRFTHVH